MGELLFGIVNLLYFHRNSIVLPCRVVNSELYVFLIYCHSTPVLHQALARCLQVCLRI